MNTAILKTLTMTAIMLISCAAPSAGVVMIAHPSVPVDSIDEEMVRQIFLGKTTLWNDELAMAPVVIKAGPVRNEFLKTYVGKSSAQFSTFWKKAVFTGTGTPPAQEKTESKLIAFVAATEGAVGFIDDETLAEDVKVLAIE